MVHSFLSINGLELDLFIGCNPEERLYRQPVAIDVVLFFVNPPKGCISDAILDTVCYARCIEKIRDTATRKHFQLIEHLAYEIHSALSEELPKEVAVRISVTKLTPPLPEVKKGVSFTYSSQEIIYE